jgi:hypothetical protein
MLKQDHNITIDWKATECIGLTIEWDFNNNQVHRHIPGYFDKALICFKHEAPKKKQNSPHPHVCPNYGAKEQYTKVEEDLPPLNKDDMKYTQAVVGTLLYYGRAVDSTILPAFSAIATKQAKPTAKMMARVKQLLDYCALQEEAIMTFKASNMVLQVHSNAGYANKKKSCSQAGGHFFLSNKHTSAPNNGTILTTATII